jgi:hypothetical protein
MQLPKLFIVLGKMNSEARSITEGLESHKNASVDEQIRQKYSENPLLCGMGESNSRPQFGKLSFYH